MGQWGNGAMGQWGNDRNGEMTMKRTAGAMAIMVLLVAGTLSAAQNVTGKWTMTVSGGPHGDMAMQLVMSQEGEKVTASFDPGHNEPIELIGTMVKGVLTLKSAQSDDGSVLSMKATLKEDGTLSGQLSSVMGDMTWTAMRNK